MASNIVHNQFHPVRPAGDRKALEPGRRHPIVPVALERNGLHRDEPTVGDANLAPAMRRSCAG